MPRSAKLKPAYRPERAEKKLAAWCVNIPSDLSETHKRQQLFFDTKGEANAECDKYRARRDNFGSSLTEMTPAAIAEAAECRKLLAPYGTSPIDAIRDYIKRHAEKRASKPWGDVLAEYEAMPKERSPKYLTDLKHTAESMRSLNEKLIVEISPQDVDTALSPLAPSTRNARLRILRAVFNLAKKRGYLADNPVDRLDFAELGSKEVEVFTVDQTSALLTGALKIYPETVPFFTLGFFCGIRPDGEIQRLDWADVHLAEKQIVVRPEVSKTGRRRFVDISDNAEAWLKAYRTKGGSFTGKVVPLAKSVLTKRRRELQPSAKIKTWIQQGMRHSYCSYWLAKHEDVNKLVLQSGHDDADTMWRNYHRGVTKGEAEKFWSILPVS